MSVAAIHRRRIAGTMLGAGAIILGDFAVAFESRGGRQVKTVGLVILLLIIGPTFLGYGVWLLRTGNWRESIPAAELLIDRAIGAEPPPRNAWDRRVALFQSWMMVLFGSFFSLCLIAVLISFIPE
ncbi:hypothetical protein [Sphingomonas sp.]|uniref:hypothetical protein n=1 Tax=Sphingomonas sp. TaxID=28214 RepID=UPI001DDB935F|nr:hypothetical protein [Sphingomonas sp.]MBX9797049.1 hypothetical protein [Sphingomonas sp.]